MSYTRVFLLYLLFIATTCSPAQKPGANPDLSVEETAQSFVKVHLLHNYKKSRVGLEACWSYLSTKFKGEIGSLENFELLMQTSDYIPILQIKQSQVLLTYYHHKNWADLSILVHTNQGTKQYILELRRNHHNVWEVHAISPVSKKMDNHISV